MEIPYCPLTPVPQQERWLANRSHSEVFMCGRGAGKTTALFMAALQDMGVPGYTSVIFLRTPGALHYWLDELDRWWEDLSILRYHSPGNWVFPGGSQLCLRVFPLMGESRRYEATTWNFMGFDQADSYSTLDIQVEDFLARRVKGKGARLRSTWNEEGEGSSLAADNPWVGK
jgi:hypothetical protein